MKRRKILWLTVLCCLALVLTVSILVTAKSTPAAEPLGTEAETPAASALNPTPEATASGVSDAAETPEATAAPTATPAPEATASPAPTPSPTPTPAPTPEAAAVTLSIVCDRALESEALPDPVRAVLPADGVILGAVTVTLENGDSVWDVLQRVCREYGVGLEANWTPAYHTAYVQGIGQLYEFDCGQGSGWVYSVNGTIPGVGCSGYAPKDGDVIRWMYTCDYGNDVGG